MAIHQNRKRKSKAPSSLGYLIALLFVFAAFCFHMASTDDTEQQAQEEVPQPQPQYEPRYQPTPNPSLPGWFPVSAEVIQMIRQRSVVIHTSTGQCSGAKIGDGLVLTDLHCVVEGHYVESYVNVSGVSATVLKWDQPNDLAVLRMSSDDGTSRLELRYDSSLITVNQQIVTVMSPYGNRHLFDLGFISRDEYSWDEYGQRGSDNFSIMVHNGGYGASGSLVYTSQGRCIGILQQTGFKMDRLFIVRNLRPVEQLLSTIRQ